MPDLTMQVVPASPKPYAQLNHFPTNKEELAAMIAFCIDHGCFTYIKGNPLCQYRFKPVGEVDVTETNYFEFERRFTKHTINT